MSRKNRLLLALGYVGFLACLFEGSARLAFWIPQVSRRLEADADEDYTWRRNWVRRHREYGKQIFYKFDVYDSSKGWALEPHLKAMRVFGNKILSTNSDGFRGRKDVPRTKRKDTVRILVLGDSFTFGDEVSDDETYSYYLQEMVPHAEVINLGVHGYGHDQMLILLGEVGLRLSPDIVILGFVSADMSRNLLTFRDFAKPRFIPRPGELKLTGAPVPRPDEVLRGDWARPRLLDLLALLQYHVRKRSGLRQREMEKATAAILTNMIAVIESLDAVPILANLPIGGEISSTDAVTKSEAYMFSVCQSNQTAKCFSTRPHVAEKMATGEAFKLTGHWEPEVHRMVAEAIRDYLVDGGYVTCPGCR